MKKKTFMEEEESTVDNELLHLMEMFSSVFSPQNSQFSFCRFVLGKDEEAGKACVQQRCAILCIGLCMRRNEQKRAVKTIRKIE